MSKQLGERATRSSYQLPIRTRLARWGLRPIFRGLFHLLSRVVVTGRENVPAEGPYIIAANHISLFEPPLILAFWPVPAEAISAADVWDRRGQGWLVDLYGAIPVRRGEYDRRVLNSMLAALQAGRPLLIAPEGGRTHTPGLRRGMPGIAYVVQKSGASVVPVGIVGTSDDFLKQALRGKRRVLEMRIGKPFCLPEDESEGDQRKAARQKIVDLIMERIAELLPPEYRGVYG